MGPDSPFRTLEIRGRVGHIHGKGLSRVAGRHIGPTHLQPRHGDGGCEGDAKAVAPYTTYAILLGLGEELKRRAENCPRPDYVDLRCLALESRTTPIDSFLVKSLLKIYRRKQGDLSSPPIAIEAHAKVIRRSGFCPSKPGAPEHHQADEDSLGRLASVGANIRQGPVCPGT